MDVHTSTNLNILTMSRNQIMEIRDSLDIVLELMLPAMKVGASVFTHFLEITMSVLQMAFHLLKKTSYSTILYQFSSMVLAKLQM